MQNVVVQNYGKVMLFNLLGNTKLWQGTSKERPRYIKATSKECQRSIQGR